MIYVLYINLSITIHILIGVPSDVTTVAHLCCGYPSYLDHEGYKKADKQLYVKLAPLLDQTGINQVTLIFFYNLLILNVHVVNNPGFLECQQNLTFF